MNALETLIREMIRAEGPISLETYMRLALAHPTHGYYRARMPLGAEGDFITAPEISQMFGELIGLWAVAVWQNMGAPNRLHLVELGPGRGTLIADALRAARAVPAFLAALDLHLIETSEPLRECQAAALQASKIAAHWHVSAGDIPQGPAIIIANEFFDCLPVRHFVRAAEGWRERVVGLDAEGRLAFGLAPGSDPTLTFSGEPGDIREISFSALHVMGALAGRLARQGGALLVVDYGYAVPGRSETLQALQRHRFTDPLRAPGEADLTAHVDFAALGQAARSAGAMVHGPVPQGEWLEQLGIFERAATLRRHADTRQAAEIDLALARLTGRGAREKNVPSMGDLFKVLAVTEPGLPEPPGFFMGRA
jgi:NADH dehydrogenase [ubiquinone] 1 alpha subcomplex assembly factor 7